MQLPRINQKLELKVLHGPYASAYSTFVEDVDERSIVVVRPLVGGLPVPLRPGEAVRVEYAVENTARVAFMTTVRGLEVRVLPAILLAHPREENIELVQQREYVRLQTVLDVHYRVAFEVGRSRSGGRIFTRTRDISGNGAQILCPTVYSPGTQLELTLRLGENAIRVVGQVIRQTRQPGTEDVWTGIRFVGIDEKERDMVIRYIFEEQRERRRRGLI